jgi:hypothetical protein
VIGSRKAEDFKRVNMIEGWGFEKRAASINVWVK